MRIALVQPRVATLEATGGATHGDMTSRWHPESLHRHTGALPQERTSPIANGMLAS